MALRDELSRIAEGRALGKEEGREENTMEITRNLLNVLDDETIALKIGLIVERIAALRSYMKVFRPRP